MKKNLHVFIEVLLVLIIGVSTGACKKISSDFFSDKETDTYVENNFKGLEFNQSLCEGIKCNYKYKIVAKSSKSECSSIRYPEGTSEDIYTFDVYTGKNELSIAESIVGIPIDFVRELEFKNDCFPYTLYMSLEWKDKLYVGEVKIPNPSESSNKLLPVNIRLEKTNHSLTTINKKSVTVSQLLKSNCQPEDPQLVFGHDQHGSKFDSSNKCLNKERSDSSQCYVSMLPSPCNGSLNILNSGYRKININYFVQDPNLNQPAINNQFPDLWDQGTKRSFIFYMWGRNENDPKMGWSTPHFPNKIDNFKTKILNADGNVFEIRYLIDKKDKYYRYAIIDTM